MGVHGAAFAACGPKLFTIRCSNLQRIAIPTIPGIEHLVLQREEMRLLIGEVSLSHLPYTPSGDRRLEAEESSLPQLAKTSLELSCYEHCSGVLLMA